MTDTAKHLIIGDGDVVASANQIPLELDKLIVTRALIQANSGGGKSHAIRWLLEQTYGRIQHIVIDREGEFSTLRAVKPRMTDLLVGRDGDVAADTGTAKLLARKVLELGLSTVVDLSEMTPGQQRAYVRVFIDSINHAPRTLWKDCLIVIDEAHIFAPQKGESEARETIALLLSTGRKRGFCAVLATQRIAKLDKDVSAECLNKLIGRTSNEDLKRAAEELAQDKQSSIQLRNLEPGSFWAYGPAIAPGHRMMTEEKQSAEPSEKASEIARGALMEAARRLVLSIHDDDERVRALLLGEYPYGRREGKWYKAWFNAIDLHIKERQALREWNAAAVGGRPNP